MSSVNNENYSNLNSPLLIKGSQHSDERGIISFVNDFVFDRVKRFYVIKHDNVKTVRAWQAHKKEMKFFYVLRGKFIIKIVKLKDWENPSIESEVINYKLSKQDNSILIVPKGYANGFMNLEKDSELLVFSSSTLEESLNDDFRFDKNYFKNSNW